MDPVRHFVCGIAVTTQLARFCASAGAAQWAALHHLMEYLAAHPNFKIKYRSGMKLVDLLSGYADADWGNSSSRRSTSGIIMLYTEQVADYVEVEDAEDDGALESRLRRPNTTLQ